MYNIPYYRLHVGILLVILIWPHVGIIGLKLPLTMAWGLTLDITKYIYIYIYSKLAGHNSNIIYTISDLAPGAHAALPSFPSA